MVKTLFLFDFCQEYRKKTHIEETKHKTQNMRSTVNVNEFRMKYTRLNCGKISQNKTKQKKNPKFHARPILKVNYNNHIMHNV